MTALWVNLIPSGGFSRLITDYLLEYCHDTAQLCTIQTSKLTLLTQPLESYKEIEEKKKNLEVVLEHYHRQLLIIFGKNTNTRKEPCFLAHLSRRLRGSL